MVRTNLVVITSVVSVALVTMLVVGEGHGIVHAIRVVGAAVGGEGEGHGLGTKASRSFLTSDDAAHIVSGESTYDWLVVGRSSDLA